MELTAREWIRRLEEVGPEQDPRDDIDTASLVARFPHLAGVAVRNISIEGPHGPVPVRSYLPAGPASGPALVWVHGGAFVTGTLDMPEAHWVALEIAARGIPVLSLEYRKALHGVHYPVPTDDIRTAWEWALVHLAEWGAEGREVHLGGASAGAHVTSAVSVQLRSGDTPQPASLLLAYPVVHADVPVPSSEVQAAVRDLPVAARFFPDDMDYLTQNYAGDDVARSDPRAFAALAEADQFPPVLIVNAERDDLRPSGEAFAAGIAHAGGVVDVRFMPGTMHGFLDLPGDPSASEALELMVAWMRRRRS